jgi:hypothetical protein
VVLKHEAVSTCVVGDVGAKCNIMRSVDDKTALVRLPNDVS